MLCIGSNTFHFDFFGGGWEKTQEVINTSVGSNLASPVFM